jgi:hypothetical protein
MSETDFFTPDLQKMPPRSVERTYPISEEKAQMMIVAPEKVIPGFKPKLDEKGNRLVYPDNWGSHFRKRTATVTGSIEVGRDRDANEREDPINIIIAAPGFIGRSIARAIGKKPQPYADETRNLDWYVPENGPDPKD